MNELTAKDLMVGDWVMLTDPINYGEKVQVKEIHGDGYITVDGGITKMYEPIAITAEILEKNGFKNPTLDDPELINYVFNASFEYKSPLPNVKVLRVNYYDGVEWDFYVLLGERKSSDCGEQYEYVIIIKYVHELQHALRLAGIDITIEL